MISTIVPSSYAPQDGQMDSHFETYDQKLLITLLCQYVFPKDDRLGDVGVA